jgi:SurA N-terminal domain
MKTLTLAVLLGVLSACSQTAAQQTRRPAPTETVATVGGAPITLAEVDDKALEQPVSNFGSAKLSQALYEARRAALDDIVANRLMDVAAKAQGVERSALIEKEITAKVQPVSDAEIAAWYQSNQGRLQGAPLEQVKQPIRAYLTQERMQAIRAAFIDRLKATTAVTVMLDPPRTKVEMAASSPTRGPANAPVEVVDFSDFQ